MTKTKIATAIVFAGTLATIGTFAHANGAGDFQGYWFGTDPLDGGDSRRGLIVGDGGAVEMAGRDSFLTLCDETDRGLLTFEDGTVDGSGVLTTDNFLITCFNNGAEILLKARYRLLNDVVMVETLTTQDDTPVTEIIFHRASQDSDE